MLKLKMMLCVMMLPLVVVGCTSKQSVDQAMTTTASGVDNAASPDHGEAPLNGIISPLREADHYAKTTGRNPSILMSSADRVAHIDGQLMQYCEQYTRASSGL